METKQQGTAKKTSLGKGLGSLLGEVNTVSNFENNYVKKIPIKNIFPNPKQPRKVFDQDSLKELSESIKVDGIVQPILVSKSDEYGKYKIIAGERRWRAAMLAGMEEVPAIEREGTPEENLRIALIENIQRKDLNVIEEAEAIKSLIEEFHLTQEQCSDKIGKERSTVTNLLRMLDLPREVQQDILEARMSMGQGRALLALEDKKLILRARDIIVSKQLNVRQTEQYVKHLKSSSAHPEDSKQGASREGNPDLEYIAETLRSYLKTKVAISGSSQKGKIEISYFSPVELERLLSLIAQKLI